MYRKLRENPRTESKNSDQTEDAPRYSSATASAHDKNKWHCLQNKWRSSQKNGDSDPPPQFTTVNYLDCPHYAAGQQSSYSSQKIPLPSPVYYIAQASLALDHHETEPMHRILLGNPRTEVRSSVQTEDVSRYSSATASTRDRNKWNFSEIDGNPEPPSHLARWITLTFITPVTHRSHQIMSMKLNMKSYYL